MRASALAAVLAVFALTCGTASAHPLRFSDVGNFVGLGEPSVDPSGSRVALIATRATADGSGYLSELLLVDTRSGRTTRLVRGSDVAVPRWSPDGTRLGYLVRVQGHLQLALRDQSGHTRVITHASNDLTDFAWRPDGRAIAFAAYDPASTADYFEPGATDYTQTALVPPVHLWSVDVDGSHLRRITSGSWTVAPTDPGGIFTSQFAWSADGRALYFTRVATTASGANEMSRIERVDLASHAIVPLTPFERFEFGPQPNGDGLLYSYPENGDYLAQNQLHLLDGSRDTILSRGLDRNIGGGIWLPGERGILACGVDRTHPAAWRIGLDGSVTRLALGGLGLECDTYSSSTFDSGISASVAANGTLAFVATDATHGDELYVTRSLDGVPRRLTHVNDWISSRSLGRSTTLQWRGPNGEAEDGVVTYPPNVTAGATYPVMVMIHGGPGLSSVVSVAESSTWPRAQLFAAHGYIVFEPNYRGSDDHGNAYMTAIEGDTVLGPSADILSGVAALERLPGVDAARIGVSGWSYGGLLTSWLITQRHDFRAAVSGAAVNDETEEYDLSVSNVQNRYYLRTSPYAAGGAQVYREQSPITYADRVTTPTFVWSTTGDPVVPTTMSYSFYHALEERRVPSKFVEFVAPTHGPDTPRMTEELSRMWIAWMDRYLK